MKITIVVPLYNGQTTIELTLESLFAQSLSYDQLIIIDDASTDDSFNIAQSTLKKFNKRAILIQHLKNQGLASSYNEALSKTKNHLFITLHQDVLIEKNSLSKLVRPFYLYKDTVLSSHTIYISQHVWNESNFWQKAYISRQLYKRFDGTDGKFDCFLTSVLQKIGGFDAELFRSAGEDGDVVWKLKKIGRVRSSSAVIQHIHKIGDTFGLMDYLFEHALYAEAQGVLIRLNRIPSVKEYVRALFRQLLLVFLIIPHTRVIGFIGFILYMFFYTKFVYQTEYRNPRIFILPFVNFFLLFFTSYFMLRGFIYKKQLL